MHNPPVPQDADLRYLVAEQAAAPLTAWADYVSITKYPATVRSAPDAHAAIRDFVAYIQGKLAVTMAKPAHINNLRLIGYRDCLLARGNSPSTINTKLSYINVFINTMGAYGCDNLRGLTMPYVRRVKPRKWWLTDEAWAKLKPGCTALVAGELLVDYIEWTMETGLRVEETLRLLPSDFTDDYYSLIVPGTKNSQSAVKIPLSTRAQDIIVRRLNAVLPGGTKRVFDISYRQLHAEWHACRIYLGVQDDPTSTLKSLRRTFAATCLRKGMPHRLIQELLRHSDLGTTMEYLHLVGLSDNQETRDWLNKELGKAKDADKDRADFLRKFADDIREAGAVHDELFAKHPARVEFFDEAITAKLTELFGGKWQRID